MLYNISSNLADNIKLLLYKHTRTHTRSLSIYTITKWHNYDDIIEYIIDNAICNNLNFRSHQNSIPNNLIDE